MARVDQDAAAIVAQLAKFEHLGPLGAEGVDLSMLAPGRVRILAADARRRSAWEIARLSPMRRYPLLLVFIAEMLRERGDELIDRYCSAIQNAERTAGNAVKKQREETARARDQRSSLAGTLARILLDAIDHGEDPVSRTLREVGEQRLREAVADPGALAVPIEQERRDALHRRHQHLAQFAPAVIAALDLTASRGYERLLQAVEHTNANRHLRLLPDAPLEVLPAAWRPWTLDDQRRPVRTRYEVALWLLVRDALRARGLYRARSHRYGDPAGWMMPRVQWQRERTELAAVFGRPLDGATRLAELEATQRQLVRRLQAGFDARERVLFDGRKIIGEPPSDQRVEKPAVAGVVHGMLPLVEIASLVIETHHDIGFLDELQHRGGSVARSAARLGQLVAVLLADASGIGFARMAQASGFTEKEMRDAAARHYTPENLAAANARVLERLRLLPHRWILDELLTTSDGQRWETIGKSPIAGYAARYVGYRKRMLTWLLWLTGQYGHFGGKVIPVTEHEAWHTLDALVLLDTPNIQHTSDTHGATELVFAIFDLLGWDFVPRMDDLADRRRYRLGDPQPEIAADQLLAHRGRPEVIIEQYQELQRIAGSIKRGWIVPSLLISRMATDPRPDRTGRALREYGRIVETNFILRWAGDPVLRRRAHGALNRHENSNALHRAVSYGNRGRVRARDPETVQRQFESRRLMANLIVYWNARYMTLAFSQLDRLGWKLLDHEVAQVHNAHHEHINMYGRHDIDLRTGPRKGKHRPLRQPPQLRLPATSQATNATATNA